MKREREMTPAEARRAVREGRLRRRSLLELDEVLRIVDASLKKGAALKKGRN